VEREACMAKISPVEQRAIELIREVSVSDEPVGRYNSGVEANAIPDGFSIDTQRTDFQRRFNAREGVDNARYFGEPVRTRSRAAELYSVLVHEPPAVQGEVLKRVLRDAMNS